MEVHLKNKAIKYNNESIKNFCDWLDTCPCEFETIEDNFNIIKFEPLKRK
jgi:hypothetical protein